MVCGRIRCAEAPHHPTVPAVACIKPSHDAMTSRVPVLAVCVCALRYDAHYSLCCMCRSLLLLVIYSNNSARSCRRRRRRPSYAVAAAPPRARRLCIAYSSRSCMHVLHAVQERSACDAGWKMQQMRRHRSHACASHDMIRCARCIACDARYGSRIDICSAREGGLHASSHDGYMNTCMDGCGLQ